MKIVVMSDTHWNYDVWHAFPEEYDELWVLGNLVNFGPDPLSGFERNETGNRRCSRQS